MSPPIRLTEYIASTPHRLTVAERDALQTVVPSMSITAASGAQDEYILTPGGTIGLVRVGELQVEIAPRLPVERVLFLVSYALDPTRWRDDVVHAMKDTHLFEAIIPTFAHHVRSCLRRGLLYGYRTIEETHTTVRGRIRLADQLRARPGLLLPVELQRDDFTADILENRLLLAATERLWRLPLRHESSRKTLRDLRSQFANVSPTVYPSLRVPEPVWTRLNGRYRPAITLARLILGGGGVALDSGDVAATGVLLDMPRVFEDFVVRALREALDVSASTFPQGGQLRGKLTLDVEGLVRLKPDLSWWVDGACVFAGDCKYKRIKVDGVPNNADLYQLLAYTTAFDLEEGLLIYAAGERRPGARTVRHAGKRLHVHTLHLAGTPDAVLDEVALVAREIRRMARRAHHRTAVA